MLNRTCGISILNPQPWSHEYYTPYCCFLPCTNAYCTARWPDPSPGSQQHLYKICLKEYTMFNQEQNCIFHYSACCSGAASRHGHYCTVHDALRIMLVQSGLVASVQLRYTSRFPDNSKADGGVGWCVHRLTYHAHQQTTGARTQLYLCFSHHKTNTPSNRTKVSQQASLLATHLHWQH